MHVAEVIVSSCDAVSTCLPACLHSGFSTSFPLLSHFYPTWVLEQSGYCNRSTSQSSHCTCLQATFDSPDPASTPLPEPWQSQLDAFQRLLVLRCLRPDKMVGAMRQWVADELGHQVREEGVKSALCGLKKKQLKMLVGL